MSREFSEWRRGFTLVEICMAIAIGMLMLSLAVPSLRGVFSEQRLRDRMGEFEEVVRRAAAAARESKQEMRIRWYKEGLAIEPAESFEEAREPVLAFEFGKEEQLELKRVAARADKPGAEWSFWPSGIREPVEVAYKSGLGVWALRFGPMTPDPDIIEMRAR